LSPASKCSNQNFSANPVAFKDIKSLLFRLSKIVSGNATLLECDLLKKQRILLNLANCISKKLNGIKRWISLNGNPDGLRFKLE